jgi:polyisoprenoid-binding protein YceI
VNILGATWFRIAAVLVVIAGMAGGGYGLWYVFLRPSDASAVSVSGRPLPSLTGAANVPTAVVNDGDGEWTVNTSIGTFSEFTGSFVGYRVQEELAGIGGQTTVGRTPQVSGSLTVQDRTVTAASIRADLTSLVSDDERRDGQLRRQALETNAFPTATFVLTEPIALPASGKDGSTQQGTATGELTLHGVTRTVQVPIKGRLDGGVVVLTGSIDITFADYGIAKPQAMIVLSVADHGTMEFQLFFTQVQG